MQIVSIRIPQLLHLPSFFFLTLISVCKVTCRLTLYEYRGLIWHTIMGFDNHINRDSNLLASCIVLYQYHQMVAISAIGHLPKVFYIAGAYPFIILVVKISRQRIYLPAFLLISDNRVGIGTT